MEKVRQGEAVSIKAATWNSFVDAAQFVKEAKQNRAASGISAGSRTANRRPTTASPRSSSRACA